MNSKFIRVNALNITTNNKPDSILCNLNLISLINEDRKEFLVLGEDVWIKVDNKTFKKILKKIKIINSHV